MSRYSVLALPVAILAWIVTIVLFFEYQQTMYQQLQERHCAYAVNYAADAAVDALIEGSDDLLLDYSMYEDLAVDPNVALETFLLVFCKNFGMAATKTGYSLVKTEYIPAFVVAVYDGYYVASLQSINEDARDLVFSMKQPYIYTEGAATYALNLSMIDAKKFENATIQKVIAPISRARQKELINSQISDAVTSTVYKAKGGNIQGAFYVPTEVTSITTTNPIDRVTVLAYVSGVDLGFGRTVESFGIGGAKVTQAKRCVGYERSGQLLYAPIERVPDGVVVKATFGSATEAAEAGYYFDMSILVN